MTPIEFEEKTRIWDNKFKAYDRSKTTYDSGNVEKLNTEYISTWISDNYHVQLNLLDKVLYAFDGVVWMPIPDETLRGFIKSLLPFGFVKASHTLEILRLVRDERMTNKLNQMHEHINFKNGILLTPNDPNSFIYRDSEDLAGYECTSVMPFDFIPDALCPTWDYFINSICEQFEEGEKVQEVILMFLGSILANHCKHRCALWLCGYVGQNGKGVLTTLISRMFGKYYKTADIEEFNAKHGMVGIEKAKVLCIPEMSIDFPKNDAKFKAVISGDIISVQPKGEPYYQCEPTCSIILCSNGLPRFPRSGAPIMDRLRLIKLSRTFGDNPDKNLGKKLEAEMSGIFNHLLTWYNKLRQANWVIPETRGMASDKKTWFSEMDSVWEFVDSRVWVTPILLKVRRQKDTSGLYILPVKELWDCYNKWVEFQDVISKPKRERFVESLLTKMKSGRQIQNTKGKHVIEFEPFLIKEGIMDGGHNIIEWYSDTLADRGYHDYHNGSEDIGF